MIEQGSIISCGGCKFPHLLINEGYVELMTVFSVCLFLAVCLFCISYLIAPRLSLYFIMSCPGMHCIKSMQFLVITCLAGGMRCLSDLVL